MTEKGNTISSSLRRTRQNASMAQQRALGGNLLSRKDDAVERVFESGREHVRIGRSDGAESPRPIKPQYGNRDTARVKPICERPLDIGKIHANKQGSAIFCERSTVRTHALEKYPPSAVAYFECHQAGLRQEQAFGTIRISSTDPDGPIFDRGESVGHQVRPLSGWRV